MTLTRFLTKHVNIFALHYFLWFAALTSIYGFINVYAQHYANTNATQYGYLNSVLPFVTIFTKILFCSLADRYRAYRFFFVGFLLTALLGYGSFALLPYVFRRVTKDQGLQTDIWATICIMTSLATISMSVISCLSDAFAMNSTKKYNITYGSIRLWGTVGWGISSLVLSQINQANLPYLVPGILMLIALITTDIIAVIIWPNNDDFNLNKSARDNQSDIEDQEQARNIANPASSPRHYGSTSSTQINSGSQEKKGVDLAVQWSLFKRVVVMRPSIIRYMILFVISGSLIALQWSYFFQYLEFLFKKDFAFVSGLSMFVQSMLGELPFFIISSWIVKYLGRSSSLSLSIATIGLRYFMYAFLLDWIGYYGVFLTEPLAGPNFGLYYVVMTDVALDYSDCDEAIDYVMQERGYDSQDMIERDRLRNSLRATMQGVMSACYEGLGVGLGSLIGGMTIDRYGFERVWPGAAFIAISLGIINMLLDLFKTKSTPSTQAE